MIIFSVLLILLGIAVIYWDKEEEKTQATEKKVAPVQNRGDELKSMKVPGNFPKKLNLYFGSQSGTAEKFCQVLEDEAKQLGAFEKVAVINFEDYSEDNFGKSQDELNIVCVATHYEGDPCDNTAKFYSWLKKQKKGSLSNLKFSVFGLGDTAYENFNSVGKYFNKQFEELGGERLYKFGEGNSQFQKTEEQFDDWKADLWLKLIEYYSQRNTSGERKKVVKKVEESALPIKVVYGSTEPVKANLEMTARNYQNSRRVKIHTKRELRQSTEDGSSLEIIFDLEGSGLSYKTAQNLAMFPENTDEDVQKVLDHIGVDGQQVFRIMPQTDSVKLPFPQENQTFTVFEAVKKFVDLRGAIGKKTLKQFADFCQVPE